MKMIFFKLFLICTLKDPNLAFFFEMVENLLKNWTQRSSWSLFFPSLFCAFTFYVCKAPKCVKLLRFFKITIEISFEVFVFQACDDPYMDRQFWNMRICFDTKNCAPKTIIAWKCLAILKSMKTGHFFIISPDAANQLIK